MYYFLCAQRMEMKFVCRLKVHSLEEWTSPDPARICNSMMKSNAKKQRRLE